MQPYISMLVACCMMHGGLVSAGETLYRSPAALVHDAQAPRLYVAQQTARRVEQVDTRTRKVLRTYVVPQSPTGLALSVDGAWLLVTAGSEDGEVYVIDTDAQGVLRRIPAGHTPMAPVLHGDGETAYLANRFDNTVSTVSLASMAVVATIPVPREPVALALTPDSSELLIVHHLPAGPAVPGRVAAAVSILDTASKTLIEQIHLHDGGTCARGICVSPDGAFAYVTHLLGRYQLPTSHLERGWVMGNALAVLDLQAHRLLTTVLLDSVEAGAANPWGVACSADGETLCIAHAGSHEVSLIDRRELHARIALVRGGSPYAGGFSDTLDDVPQDLGFLAGLRTRIPLSGLGPRAIALEPGGSLLFAAEYFSDSVGVVDTVRRRLGPSIAWGPQPVMDPIRKGEFIFHDASEGSFQEWLSCASCHPDGRSDALNWDLANDGYGSPRQSKSLLYAHPTPPAMITGVRADAEGAVRAGFRYIQFSVQDEVVAAAVDAYLRSLQPISSPYLEGGQLSSAARRGRLIFQGRCAACHSGSYYTDLAAHDVGTGRGAGEALDTAGLAEIWRTAPYLQDGRAATIMDVLTTHNRGHFDDTGLTVDQLQDLAEYVLSLPYPSGPFPRPETSRR